MVALSSETTAPSSTPSRGEAIFSDDTTRLNTPPSSPPGFPWERLSQKQEISSEDATTSSPQPPKNAFSVLGKRKSLQDVSDNVRPKKQAKAAKVKDGASKGMVQLQMSLGQEMQKKCTQCGMEYTASSAEDRKLHDKFHKQNVEGYDVGKDFVSKTVQSEKCPRQFKGVGDADAIVFLDCSDPWQRKRKGQAVLEIAQRELGAVEIPERDIWDMQGQYVDNPRFKAYLYIRGTKCVGFLLTEKISEAFEVLQPNNTKIEPERPTTGKITALAALKARKDAEKQALSQADKCPISLSTSKSRASLGISRIWTSPTHRGQGIAKCLLEVAHGHSRQCHYWDLMKRLALIRDMTGTPAEKEAKKEQAKRIFKLQTGEGKGQAAFSQPTESGAKLARRWMGKPYGWKVYVD